MPTKHSNDWAELFNLANLEPYERAPVAWNDRHGTFAHTYVLQEIFNT